MKQEIVPFIESHPVISGILFLVFCASTGWVTGLYILGPCLIWANKLRRKPKPADGEEAAFRSMMTATRERQERERETFFMRLDELQKKEDEAKESLLTISNEELADKLRDPSIFSVELVNSIRNEALARLLDLKKAESFPRDYVLTKEDEKELIEVAKKRAAFAFYDKRLAEGDPRTAAQIAVDLAIQFHEIGMTPEIQQRLAPLFQATIKAHMTPSAAPEAAEKTGEAYKSNVATGIRSLPEIDLYNLLAGEDTLEDHYSYTNRIINKWDDSPKEKRPAVLRVCMNTLYGQYVANLLKTFGIPVEPKRKP